MLEIAKPSSRSSSVIPSSGLLPTPNCYKNFGLDEGFLRGTLTQMRYPHSNLTGQSPKIWRTLGRVNSNEGLENIYRELLVEDKEMYILKLTKYWSTVKAYIHAPQLRATVPKLAQTSKLFQLWHVDAKSALAPNRPSQM
ncbi:hypothetical protein F511_25042 [Dorcoceras hygrometricum]|uniref:Uncharacterized protein n=1 Tax=Dorcoceras hygrometricum TaxID=472368 RepID=A0A2Z7AHE0_9LAMI|nr:hypothetical protein F511_25042 [Dorcoceras hygrometricum]